MRRRLAALSGLALLTLASAAGAGDGARTGRGPVVAVELRSDRELDRPEDLEELVAIQVGRPLDREELRRTLRNLHASGSVGEVEAYRIREEDGERVVLALWSLLVVEEVSLAGELGLDERGLLALVPRPASPTRSTFARESPASR